MEVPFSYDPSVEDYKVGLAYTTLRFSPHRAVVVNNACPHCGEHIVSYPVFCDIEDGVWKVKHGFCGGVIYEEKIPKEDLRLLESKVNKNG